MWRPNMFSRVNNTSQNIITTATTQEYGRNYLYMYSAAITGHHNLNKKSIDIKVPWNDIFLEENLHVFYYEMKYSLIESGKFD